LQTIELENQAPNIANKEEKAYGSPKRHKLIHTAAGPANKVQNPQHDCIAKEG
jgi:hypothetical protein